ncbi:Piso0_000139 [Millerozyma farinosa CBS 7064]|uniref:Piso0_000139 protein n=1 Tax=Pichia sorbitophila (strain ATCC MYA-4447 / BCRC 22081 / CBS 7064 / NBRC 10061 / NRRL Y-12695) TaxID=559304 RepID=G8YUM2_PICSO|nr:Piso0_000139 [Millerozyma farinosa CBS 7064]
MSTADSKIDNESGAGDIKTNILIIGGAYAGLSAVRCLAHHIESIRMDSVYKDVLASHEIHITLVEPRCGLLNILGIPRAIVDTEFARTQYVPFDELEGVQFDRVVSESVVSSVRADANAGKGYSLTFVHGKVTYVDEEKARYELVKETGEGREGTIAFDYVVVASGRNRSWPTTPLGYTLDSFLREMDGSKKEIETNDIITVVGAGAVGIEIAGDIKHYAPSKTVNLVHAHKTFPPEPLSREFQDLALDSLVRSGVNVHLNTRIAKELPGGDLQTVDGNIIKSQLNYWCSSHSNNIEFLADSLKKEFVTPKNNVLVNEYMQLLNKDKKLQHFFCIGDIVELPIIKSAGWAMYMGRQVATNLISLMLSNTLVEPFPDLSQMPRGMVLVAGNGEIVSELGGEVELNHKGYSQEYEDYCMGKIRATIGV